VSLNISGTRKSRNVDDRRRQLADQLLTELAWGDPRERMAEFKAWLRGSLSLIHLHVLSILEAEGPISMSRLADALDVSVASATGIVSRMEQRKLVERRHSEADRRVVLVHRTDRGDHVLAVMATRRRQRLGRIIDQLTDDELQAFLVGVRAMRAARAKLADELTRDAEGDTA
jgi:DNA-binding MarR family transcriptional regulator